MKPLKYQMWVRRDVVEEPNYTPDGDYPDLWREIQKSLLPICKYMVLVSLDCSRSVLRPAKFLLKVEACNVDPKSLHGGGPELTFVFHPIDAALGPADYVPDEASKSIAEIAVMMEPVWKDGESLLSEFEAIVEQLQPAAMVSHDADFVFVRLLD